MTDGASWVKDGTRQIEEAGAAARPGLLATVNAFHGLSPYDRHAWYKTSKNIANALLWSSEVLRGPAPSAEEGAVSAGNFADRLIAYRSVVELMIVDLDRFAAAYQEEHAVKEPPGRLTEVRDHARAFRTMLQHVIDAAPAGTIRSA